MIFLVILVVFILAWIGTAIFGYVVYGNVLKTAERTDNALRSLTWAALVYACEHEGRFPTSDVELFATQPLPDQITCIPEVAGAWPTTLDEVLEGGQLVEDLKFSSRKLKLYFASEGSLPPVFDANGMPTQLNTIETLKVWLGAFSEAHPIVSSP